MYRHGYSVIIGVKFRRVSQRSSRSYRNKEQDKARGGRPECSFQTGADDRMSHLPWTDAYRCCHDDVYTTPRNDKEGNSVDIQLVPLMYQLWFVGVLAAKVNMHP